MRPTPSTLREQAQPSYSRRGYDRPAMSDYVRELLGSGGVSEEDIERAADQGWLALLVVEHKLLPSASRFTEEEVIARTGADPELGKRLWRAMGFPDAERGETIFTNADIEALGAVLGQIKSAPEPDPIENAVHEARAVSSALSRVAEVATDRLQRVLDALRQQGLSEFEIAELVARNLELEQFDRLLAYLYRRQFRAAMWRKLATHRDSESVVLAAGFVDIVGFTTLSRQLGPPELADLIARFEAGTHDTVAGLGGRVVKMIGDEIMFAADDPATGVEIGLAVLEANARDDLQPDIRVGLAWGPVISRDGDYFGPVVNLASRVVSISRPGRFVVSEETYKALRGYPEFNWRRLPPRPVKDIGVVRLWSPRRPASAEQGSADVEVSALQKDSAR